MNYTALFLQLLPETVLVIAALVLMGVAVATQSRKKRPPTVDVVIAITALGIAAAGFALNVAGLDFSNIAIIAGALGVGIGFGLQSIVNNFISGLILLAERPIRVGDWVSLPAGEGLVKRINVRATEIETFDSCTIIVPNSDLITKPVNNWTHDDTLGRFTVSVGIAYNSDVDDIRGIMLDIAKAHRKVLTYPEPTALLTNFALNSMTFEVRGHVADIFEATVIASDIRQALVKAFREKGIIMPVPQ